MKKLTRCEQAMLDRLRDEVRIKWIDARGSDTSTLNRLVKKGVAEVYAKDGDTPSCNTFWQVAGER